MNTRHTCEAIILRRWDYGEKDQIANFLTPQRGRLQGIAKGAKVSRRRFGGTLDLFSLIEITFKEKKTGQLILIEEARLLTHFPRIRSRYNAILLANGFLEMAYRFYQEGSSEPKAFEILLQALKCLEERGEAKELFWKTFLAHLKILGLYPQFRQCIRCGIPLELGPLSFDVEGGGSACSHCTSIPSRYRILTPALLHWLTLNEPDAALNGSIGSDDQIILEEILSEHLKSKMDLEFQFDSFLDFIE